MFKVGDKVRCIEISKNGYFGEIGKIYTISSIVYNVYICLHEDYRKKGLSPFRFELVKEKVMKIANYEVTNIRKDSVDVGCTKVTRQQVEEILKLMDEIKELKIIKGKKYRCKADPTLVVMCTKSDSKNGVVVKNATITNYTIGDYSENWNWLTRPYHWELLED